MTVPVALVQFLNNDDAQWNYLMATTIIMRCRQSRSIARSPLHDRRPHRWRLQGLSLRTKTGTAAADPSGNRG
jgi:hypothetical protein